MPTREASEPSELSLAIADSPEPLLLRQLQGVNAPDTPEEPQPTARVLLIHPAGRDSTLWTESLEADPTGDDGRSWMQLMADSGLDCWALDIRGYGGSGWGHSGPPEDPFLCSRADQAVYDVDAVAEHILGLTDPSESGPASLHIVGWGWGGMVAALFAGETDLPIASLTILAPRLGEPNDDPQAEADWTSGSGSDTVPTGARIDLMDVSAGQPVFDPADISCPTLLVRAIDDPGTTESDVALLYLRLGTETKQLWEVPGDHFQFVTGTDAASTAERVAEWISNVAAQLMAERSDD